MAASSARSVAFWSAALLVTAFALSHPYTGIRHDGILYLGDALARLDPGRYDEDLYFLFGSQGRYTVLPTVYAGFISVFGIGNGTIVGLLSVQALYLITAFFFIGSFAPSGMRFHCALAVVLGWSLYGGFRVFAFAEPFLTARSFAEPAVLISLGLLCGGRWGLALVSLSIAAMFHPLMAAGGFLVFLFYQAEADRRLLGVLLVGPIVLLLLGWMRVGPFADVFVTYDASWLSLAQDSNPQAFTTEWVLVDYGIVVYNAVLLLFAAHRVADKRVGRLVRACLFAGMGATVASFLLVDIAHSVFFGKLQIWRALWIMQWVAIATLPLTVSALWRSGETARVTGTLLVVGWIAPFTLAPAPVAFIALCLDRLGARVEITRSLTRIVIGVTLVAGLIVVGQQASRAFSSSGLSMEARVSQTLTTSLVLFVLIAGIWRLAIQRNRLAQALAGVLLVSSFGLWDQRSAWIRVLEDTPLGTHIWEGLIDAGAKVYWYHELVAPWVLLGHANYYTTQQGSGAVFSRDMVEELERRRKLTGLLEFQEQLCRVVNSLNEKSTSCEPDVLVVRNVCTETQVDFVVLQNTLEGTTSLADYATSIFENGFEKKFYLYRCSTLATG